ncbi:MAG TPA: DNA topoisomerase IB, partial [Candidatus Limnocylindria bacterium]|nr:DNA topoisomerase IB [Candidatus Limnocylindria bacterium]
VWISPSAVGHIQATGRDARGRKQYRYHQRWREVRDEAKYGRLSDFARALPRIRSRIDADLARTGVPREKVLATAVRLLEETFIRIGNAEYAKANRSFGLTTLRNKHVDVDGTRLRFRFRGKSGKDHEVDVRDGRLARIVGRLQELPGQHLFQYLDDDGSPHPIGSEDVNEYLRDVSGEDISAKEFRTWAGTVLAARTLAGMRPARNERIAAKRINEAIDVVASRLGNTRAVCRQCYVHPAVVDAYVTGTLPPALARSERERRDGGLSAHEAAVASLLGRAARRSARRAA